MSHSDQFWSEKVVFVTGGSSGIGLAAARLLATMGAHVWLAARRKPLLEAALKDLEAVCRTPSQHCGIVSADLSDPEQAAEAVSKVIAIVGTPDVIINSAGVAHPGYIQDLPLDVFRWMMDVNYFATVHTIKALLPGMIERRAGHIINISSIAGYMGIFGYTAYGASKFAVAGFSEVLRAEMKPYGVRVSVAFPPDTDTPQLAYENQFKPPEEKAISGTTRPLSAVKVATAILQQAARGQFLIFPGTDARLFYLLDKFLPKTLVFAVLDGLAAQGRNKKPYIAGPSLSEESSS